MRDDKFCGEPGCAVEITANAEFCIYHRGWNDALRSEQTRTSQALNLRDEHRRNSPPGVAHKCQCLGCEMGRALQRRPLMSHNAKACTDSRCPTCIEIVTRRCAWCDSDRQACIYSPSAKCCPDCTHHSPREYHLAELAKANAPSDDHRERPCPLCAHGERENDSVCPGCASDQEAS